MTTKWTSRISRRLDYRSGKYGRLGPDGPPPRGEHAAVQTLQTRRQGEMPLSVLVPLRAARPDVQPLDEDGQPTGRRACRGAPPDRCARQSRRAADEAADAVGARER